jgi:MtN3 and saliva related transmembrane protein
MVALEVLGFIASSCLILSSVPQAIHTFKTKSVAGLSVGTLLLWFFGVIMMGIYVSIKSPQVPLLINYAFNTVIVGINLFLYLKYSKKPAKVKVPVRTKRTRS